MQENAWTQQKWRFHRCCRIIPVRGLLYVTICYFSPWLERFFENPHSVDHPVCKWIVTPVAHIKNLGQTKSIWWAALDRVNATRRVRTIRTAGRVLPKRVGDHGDRCLGRTNWGLPCGNLDMAIGEIRDTWWLNGETFYKLNGYKLSLPIYIYIYKYN